MSHAESIGSAYHNRTGETNICSQHADRNHNHRKALLVLESPLCRHYVSHILISLQSDRNSYHQNGNKYSIH